jgi:uncharacterized protein
MSSYLNIDEDEMQRIRERLRREEERDKTELILLRENSLKTANKIADFLREKYKVTKVVLFGSILRPESFHKNSDIDLAAWDINEKDTFKAISDVLYVGKGILVNLVDVNTCSLSLLNIILRDGKEI